jgi:hypothetical protein
MFSADQVSLYLKYRGDIDGLAHVGSASEKSLMSESDWFQLADLIDSVAVARAGHASSEFKAKAEQAFAEAVPDAGLRAALEKAL